MHANEEATHTPADSEPLGVDDAVSDVSEIPCAVTSSDLAWCDVAEPSPSPSDFIATVPLRFTLPAFAFDAARNDLGSLDTTPTPARFVLARRASDDGSDERSYEPVLSSAEGGVAPGIRYEVPLPMRTSDAPPAARRRGWEYLVFAGAASIAVAALCANDPGRTSPSAGVQIPVAAVATAKIDAPLPNDPVPEPQPSPFDHDAAVAALAGHDGQAIACFPDAPGGSVGITVTFAPAGVVTAVSLEGRTNGELESVASGCVAEAFRGAVVRPFVGEPTTLHRVLALPINLGVAP